ncbi:MAG: aspartate carbamoyltransferase regulatory subunit [Methanosarcinales archaeon]|nr:aspartate carbamoyltransferase regulatory subunit [Methanosarcinales archaeon]
MTQGKELRVHPIRDGTVIDHINAGQAMNVLKILGITGSSSAVISVAMNVSSQDIKSKDIVKIEDRELKDKEVDKIALISPNATINIIRDFGVAGKHRVKLPEMVESMVKCANPNCISNTNEPVTSKFEVKKDPIRLRCIYCEHVITENIVEHLL